MSKIKPILRQNSILTEKNNLEILYILKNFPVFMGCSDLPIATDLKMDMRWVIDPDTGIIQLDQLVPLDILYREQHVDGTGERWSRYYHALSNFIIKQRVKRILEVGGGLGKLAQIFINQTKETHWTIVEPNPLNEKYIKRVKIIKGFFDEKFKNNGNYDSLVLSQVYEHLYDPNKFLYEVNKYFRKGDKLIIGHPNLLLMLQNKYTNTLNFEHTIFLTEYVMDYLLQKNGFEIVDKEYYIDHSIFYCAEKISNPRKQIHYENKYSEYKQIFEDFISYHINLVNKLNLEISGVKYPIYLFGAHIFSQYLINFGLKTNNIMNILDNSILKQGRRLYGTDLLVESPKILKGKGPVIVILKAAGYNEEIKQDILENINKDVIFI